MATEHDPANTNWHVVTTLPGQHEAVEQRLELDGFLVLHALRRYEIKHARKVEKKVELAFKGFVLVQFDLSNPAWWRIRRTQGVRDFIRTAGGQPGTADPGEIARMRQALADAGYLRDEVIARDPRLLPGAGVKVLNGPFSGHMGEIDTMTPDERVKALVNIFGRKTPVTLDLVDVQPV